ncbi:MAG TPA: VRR-NUC domain-containing protein [Candidatus Lumbricidophila sp.]|nr:VRR-NUC domain-containing protein [Candidatus Lumbricidophila sp.]
MGKPENVVEQRLRTHVEALSGLCLKFISSRSGVPDRIVVLRGKTVFVELKAPGGRLSSLQKIRIKQLREAGADVRVITSKDEVDRFIAEFVLN